MIKQRPTLIIAGHYCVSTEYSDLSYMAETEIHSLMLGIELFKRHHRQGKVVKLVIWINDIGLLPQQRKQFQQNYNLPENYAELVVDAGIDKSDIFVRFESRARNRASKLIRKLKLSHDEIISEQDINAIELIRCVDYESNLKPQANQAIISIANYQGKSLVIKEGGSAKCCAILAVFFNDLVEQLEPRNIIGVFNFIYSERIKAGLFVAQSLFRYKLPTQILFCDETNIVHTDKVGVINDDNDLTAQSGTKASFE